MSSVLVFYTVGYCLWCFFYREQRLVPPAAAAPPGRRQRWCSFFLADLGYAIGLFWALANVRALASGP